MNTPKTTLGLTQWLLEFVNLPFKQGILSVFRPIVKPLKRTPTKEPEPLKGLSKETIKGLKEYYKKQGYTKGAINKAIAEHESNRGIVDHKGYSWEMESGKPVFAGYDKCYPTEREFNIFLGKYGFTQSGKEFELWNKVFHVFSYLARVNKKLGLGEYEESLYLIGEFCREYEKDNRVRFGGSLENTICACIYGFWEKHKDLHSRLRQCLCCGSFWIKENNKRAGRSNKFCSTKCEDRFNQQSREKDISNKRRYRQMKYVRIKSVIVKCLTENHSKQNKNGKFSFVTKERAEEIYNDLPKKAKTSLKDFNKNWAKPRGYKLEDI